MKSFIKEYGNEIKRLRKSANLSQIQLSSLSNIERSQISKIEQGLVDGVTMFTIEKIFYALGYTLRPEKKSIEELNIHPFVKWAGGKTQLLEVIKTHLPSHFNRYYEPFVGGGALLFDLKPSSFSINDSNEELMLTFKCFEDDVLYQKLIEELKIHENNHSEEYYYKIRELDKDKEFTQLCNDILYKNLYYDESKYNRLKQLFTEKFFLFLFRNKELLERLSNLPLIDKIEDLLPLLEINIIPTMFSTNERNEVVYYFYSNDKFIKQ